MENIQKNIPEVSNKQNFNMPYTGNYLHSTDIVLGITSNLEIKVEEHWMCLGYMQIQCYFM